MALLGDWFLGFAVSELADSGRFCGLTLLLRGTGRGQRLTGSCESAGVGRDVHIGCAEFEVLGVEHGFVE